MPARAELSPDARAYLEEAFRLTDDDEDLVRLHIDPRLYAHLPRVAPGVIGNTHVRDGVLYLELLYAERPGSGDVGRYLDSLPRTQTIRASCVISRRMAGILARRGFRPIRITPDQAIDTWERSPT